MHEAQSTIRAIAAAWHLLMRRPNAIAEFDNSVGGFWHSFLALPFALGMRLMLDYGAAAAKRPLPGAVGSDGQPIESLSPAAVVLIMGVAWLSFPIAMIFIARLMKLTRRYVIFIIAHNWGSLLIFFVSAIATALYIATGFDLEALVAILFVVALVQIYFGWYIARQGLATNAWTAVAVVAFELLFSGIVTLSLFELVEATGI